MNKFYFSAISFALVFWINLKPAITSQLVDIRTGFHQIFSRVVIQLQTPVRYQVITDHNNQSVIVEMLRVTQTKPLVVGDVRIDPGDPVLRQVSYLKKEHLFAVTAFLRSSDFEVKQYQLDWPFRIVIDIYQSGFRLAGAQMQSPETLAAEFAVHENTTGAESIEDSTITVQIEAADNVPPEVLKYTQVFTPLPDEEKKEKPAETHETKVAAPMESSGSANIFWVFGVVFLLFDAMIMVLYLNKRKKKCVPSAKQRKRHLRVVNSETYSFPNTARADDQVLVPEPSAQDFVDLLKEALKNEDLQDSVRTMEPGAEAGYSKASWQHSFTAPLTDIADEPPPPPAPPDFKEIVDELATDSSTTENLTEEHAREQLIGRDGIDFMKNVKKLYLN